MGTSGKLEIKGKLEHIQRCGYIEKDRDKTDLELNKNKNQGQV